MDVYTFSSCVTLPHSLSLSPSLSFFLSLSLALPVSLPRVFEVEIIRCYITMIEGGKSD